MPKRSTDDDRPRANPRLVVTLLVVAVAAGGYWGYRYMTRDVDEGLVAISEEIFTLWCPSCKEAFKIPGKEAANRPRQGRNIQCPKCQQFTAKWGEPPETPDGAVLP